MSNLGSYQSFTTVSKIFHGPWNLMGIIATVSAAVGAVGGIAIKNRIMEKRKNRESLVIYTVKEDGISNEVLQLKAGNQFRVLGKDGDAVCIEKMGDDNSPYYVSAKFLSSISDYVINK